MENAEILVLRGWAKAKHIELLHIQPGKPAQKAYIELCNRSYCEEVLDAYLFDDLQEVRHITHTWLKDSNTICLQEALQRLPPRQFTLHHASICLFMSGATFGRLTQGISFSSGCSISSCCSAGKGMRRIELPSSITALRRSLS